MDNQHRKISGYRELSQNEINLINLIKLKGEDVYDLIKSLQEIRRQAGIIELGDQGLAESYRCIDIAKTSLQTGFMWLVHAVALPRSF